MFSKVGGNNTWGMEKKSECSLSINITFLEPTD